MSYLSLAAAEARIAMADQQVELWTGLLHAANGEADRPPGCWLCPISLSAYQLTGGYTVV